MRVFTCYSPSHEFLYEKYLLPSIPAGHEVIARKIPQKCESGEYHAQGWCDQMREKLKFMCEMVENNEKFVFLDVDVKIIRQDAFERMNAELGDRDIAFQNDANAACAGVFIGRRNERTISVFREALRDIQWHKCDQPAINSKLRLCKWALLSREFWNYGLLGRGVWNGKVPFNPPSGISLIHANWTVGMENKVKILELVQSDNTQT